MAGISFNGGVSPKAVKFNGADVAEVKFDGVSVWKKEKVIKIAHHYHNAVGANGGWYIDVGKLIKQYRTIESEVRMVVASGVVVPHMHFTASIPAGVKVTLENHGEIQASQTGGACVEGLYIDPSRHVYLNNLGIISGAGGNGGKGGKGGKGGTGHAGANKGAAGPRKNYKSIKGTHLKSPYHNTTSISYCMFGGGGGGAGRSHKTDFRNVAGGGYAGQKKYGHLNGNFNKGSGVYCYVGKYGAGGTGGTKGYGKGHDGTRSRIHTIYAAGGKGGTSAHFKGEGESHTNCSYKVHNGKKAQVKPFFNIFYGGQAAASNGGGGKGSGHNGANGSGGQGGNKTGGHGGLGAIYYNWNYTKVGGHGGSGGTGGTGGAGGKGCIFGKDEDYKGSWRKGGAAGTGGKGAVGHGSDPSGGHSGSSGGYGGKGGVGGFGGFWGATGHTGSGGSKGITGYGSGSAGSAGVAGSAGSAGHPAIRGINRCTIIAKGTLRGTPTNT